jgi:serine/threonine-protein kinase
MSESVRPAPSPKTDEALGATVAAPSLPLGTFSTGARSTTTAKGTVLPTFTGEGLVHRDRPRYEVQKSLGEGGMGQVALALDHDIGRSVAIKQLHPETSADAASLARFVEEIRTVGALEHPNIVPIHDVGVAEDGRYFFVMKHLDGETLESIIEKLAAGDKATHARYTFTVRVEIMIGLLRALDYAHAQGVVHRDIKPANVMVGRYGEVVLMDWGIAKTKQSSSGGAPLPAPEVAEPQPSLRRPARLFQTRHGSLIGTPAYMSPEQARGENDGLDDRSDLYSATVVFQEFLCLKHYLDDKTTLEDMIKGVIAHPFKMGDYLARSTSGQGPVPIEFLWFLDRGLQKKPADRFPSARAMIDRLEETLDGKVHVQCPFTFNKRMTREMGRFLDRYPFLGFAVVVCAVFGVLASVALAVRALV